MILRALIASLVIWIARMAVAIPFLDDNGRLSVVLDDGHLPGAVEVFFTGLMVVYTAGAALAGFWLLRRVAPAQAVAAGVSVALGLVAGFVILDALLEVFVAQRGLALHLRNVVIDYAPLAIIPPIMGALRAQRA